jgi:hypothetical protein
MAMWHMKHAARLAASDSVSEVNAKQSHSCLRKAAGLFEYVQKEKGIYNTQTVIHLSSICVGRLSSSLEAGADLSAPVLSSYTLQCTAEAQEVTVARAIELKHKPALISALAMETAKLFEKAGKCVCVCFLFLLIVFLFADKALTQADATIFGKWRKYLQLKHTFYLSYAYAYHGEALLGQDLCGEAVRACKEGLKCECEYAFLN